MATPDRITTVHVTGDDNPATALGAFDQGGSILVRALADNTGTVYLGGDDSVDDTSGFPLAAGEAVSLDFLNPSSLHVYSENDDVVAVVVTY